MTEQNQNIQDEINPTEETTVSNKETEENKSVKNTDEETGTEETVEKPKSGKKRFKEEKIDRSELLRGFDLESAGIDELKPEIRSRENKRYEILDKLKQINKERNELKDERNNLNTEASQSFQKVQELKKKRDEVNKEIKEIKGIREGVLLELKQLSNREKEIIEVLKESNDHGRSRRGGDLRRINKEIDQLDWKLQTTPNLTRNEEKFLMERIEDLSSKLGEAESKEAIQKEIRDLRKYKSTLKATLDDNWNRLNELVKTSQDRHNRISELYEIGKAAKEKADQKHQLFVTKMKETQNYRKTIRVIKAELDLLYPKYKQIQEVKRKDLSDQRATRSTAVKEAKSTEIKKKLKGKKGLSMEEMKFLMENRLISLKKEEK